MYLIRQIRLESHEQGGANDVICACAHWLLSAQQPVSARISDVIRPASVTFFRSTCYTLYRYTLCRYIVISLYIIPYIVISLYRAYMNINEFKEALNYTNENSLVVSLTEWTQSDLIGLSTFPWEADVYSIYGNEFYASE